VTPFFKLLLRLFVFRQPIRYMYVSAILLSGMAMMLFYWLTDFPWLAVGEWPFF
jgi:hypothetical protein